MVALLADDTDSGIHIVLQGESQHCCLGLDVGLLLGPKSPKNTSLTLACIFTLLNELHASVIYQAMLIYKYGYKNRLY